MAYTKILAHRKLRQEHCHEFGASLSYSMRPCFKKKRFYIYCTHSHIYTHSHKSMEISKGEQVLFYSLKICGCARMCVCVCPVPAKARR